MKWLRAFVVIVMAASLLPSSTKALEVSPKPVEYKMPVFVTAFQISMNRAGGLQIDAVELYNESSNPINLNNWYVLGLSETQSICKINFPTNDIYILPKKYLTIADQSKLNSDNVINFSQSCNDSVLLDGLQMVDFSERAESIDGILNGGWVRKGLTATYRDIDDFTNNFEAVTERNPAVFYADKWYQPLKSTPLRVSEVMPRSKNCSPINITSPDCDDYVKIYNPTDDSWPLDGLRLRVGYQNQNVTSSNSIVLSGSLPAGGYGVIRSQADGDPLNVTDSGGWIWLEDSYGINRFDDTVVEYESASSQTKIGWAWALDNSDGVWKWTNQPTPYNQPSVISLPEAVATGNGVAGLTECRADQFRNPLTNRCKLKSATTSALTACAANQYRNPATNRCKLVATIGSSLVACKANQYRNPETNRCKSISSSSSSLVPCAANQFRNPETNRCKLLASSGSTLKPCAVGSERNPDTNRCRKVADSSVLGTADFPVEAYSDSKDQAGGWLAFGAVSSLAVGYGVWEWRREILGGISKIRGLVGR